VHDIQFQRPKKYFLDQCVVF